MPITNQRTGEFRSPTITLAVAPSFDTITKSLAPAPRLSIASNGSPSGLPSTPSNWTSSNFQPWKLGCFTVDTACPTTRASCTTLLPRQVLLDFVQFRFQALKLLPESIPE